MVAHGSLLEDCLSETTEDRPGRNDIRIKFRPVVKVGFVSGSYKESDNVFAKELEGVT